MSKPNLRPSVREEPKETPMQSKGAGNLLRRIEGLDETQKELLESILDRIEKGKVDKEILLNLEFLNLKKNLASPKPEYKGKEVLHSIINFLK